MYFRIKGAGEHKPFDFWELNPTPRHMNESFFYFSGTFTFFIKHQILVYGTAARQGCGVIFSTLLYLNKEDEADRYNLFSTHKPNTTFLCMYWWQYQYL